MSDPYIYVTCSTQNGVGVYNHGIANGGTPTDCSMLDRASFEVVKTSVFPNPFSGNTSLTFENPVQNAQLIIYNSIGQKVRKSENVNGTNILIERQNLTAGIYYVHVLEGRNNYEVQKLVVKD